HYAQADVSEKAIDYGIRLARASLKTFSAGEAVRAARTALDFLGDEESSDHEMEGQVRMLLGSAYRMSGHPEAALKELMGAAKIFEETEELGLQAQSLLQAAETAWERRQVEETT